MARKKRSPEEVKFNKDLGRRLQRAIDEKGLTQAGVSREIGISPEMLNTALRGKQQLTPYALTKAAILLGKDLNSLCGRKGRRSRNPR